MKSNQQPVRIVVDRREEPDLERFAAALLAMAMARIEAANRTGEDAKESSG